MTDIDYVVVSEGKNLLAPVVGTAGKRVLEKAFQNYVKAVEAGMAREKSALRGAGIGKSAVQLFVAALV